jgi:hypothetical protein
VLVQVSGDRDYLYRLGPTEYVSPEDGDRIQSPKRYVLNKNRAMDNVQKHNTHICTLWYRRFFLTERKRDTKLTYTSIIAYLTDWVLNLWEFNVVPVIVVNLT